MAENLSSLEEGSPITIVEALEDHTYELNVEALESILLKPDIKDKKVVVISIAGAFRKGKSFLLNFFLRYLQKKGAEDWLGNKDDDLVGFSWRSGSERETTGILMWSKPFFVQLNNGEEVAVLLMDTQGAFDCSQIVQDCATIFALSTLVSSVQVYNIPCNLQEDHLQHLQFFTNYGYLALEKMEGGRKPFQHLEFLIRDWYYSEEYSYGDGKNLMEKRLATENAKHEELRKVREQIRDCFEKLTCFLMPHPGKIVAASSKFTGKLSDIDDEFKDYLKVLAPRLLAPENLLIKSINGSELTCLELLVYFKSYMEIFASGGMPEVATTLQVTAEANNRAAIAKALRHFICQMEQLCGGNAGYVSTGELERLKETYESEALNLYNATPKMGGAEISHEFEVILKESIDQSFEYYRQVNESRSSLNIASTAVGTALGAALAVLIAVAAKR